MQFWIIKSFKIKRGIQVVHYLNIQMIVNIKYVFYFNFNVSKRKFSNFSKRKFLWMVN